MSKAKPVFLLSKKSTKSGRKTCFWLPCSPAEIWVAAFEGLYKITPRKRLFETPFSIDFDLKNGPIMGMSCYGMAESGIGPAFEKGPVF